MQSAGDILIVDDDEPIVGFMADALAEEGYTIRTALNPAAARAAIAERLPDLILLDLHLPGTSGDVLAREIKNAGRANIPVIIMTASTHAADKLSMDGIVFCLMKPFDLDDLFGCVAKHIHQGRPAAA